MSKVTPLRNLEDIIRERQEAICKRITRAMTPDSNIKPPADPLQAWIDMKGVLSGKAAVDQKSRGQG